MRRLEALESRPGSAGLPKGTAGRFCDRDPRHSAATSVQGTAGCRWRRTAARGSSNPLPRRHVWALPADGPSRDNPEIESFFGRFNVENRSLVLDAESVEELRTIVGKRIRYYRGRVALTRFPGHLTPRSSSMASSRNRPANRYDHTDLLWFGATGRAPV